MTPRKDEDWLTAMDRHVMTWLWREERPRTGPLRWGNQALQMFYLAGRSSLVDRVPFQANALTFISLLALVPALAISFSVAKGLGFNRALRELLVENELLAGQREIFEQLLQYVQNTGVGTLGAVGLVALVVTLVLTISTMEETFNRVWNVPSQRNWLRKFTDYLSVLIIFPLLMLGATGVWATFSSNEMVLWLMNVTAADQALRLIPSLGPLIMLVAAFVFIYMFLPNTQVPFFSALTAGFTAAVLWYWVQHIYIVFQVGVARYNAIYGGFASLPLFMIWMQLSWTVVLFGAQLSRAHHVCTRGPLPRILARPLGEAQREALALNLMYRAARRFHQGQDPYSQEELAQEMDVISREVNQVVLRLEDAGLLTQVGREGLLQPARSLDAVTLADVAAGMRGAATCELKLLRDTGEDGLIRIWEDACQQGREVLASTTLLDLVRQGQNDSQ